jgi:hypothetical protein
MSDGVVVAVITVVGSIVVAVITAVLSRKPTQHPPVHVSVTDRDRDKVEPPLVADRPDRSAIEAKKQVPVLAASSADSQQHAAPSAAAPRKESPVDQPTDVWEAVRNKWPVFLNDGKAMFSDFLTLPNLSAIIQDGKEYVTEAKVCGSDWENRHLEHFLKLHRLEKLEFMLCERLRDESLVFIARCKSLRHLSFSSLSSDASMRFTGAGLRQLAKLPNLEILYLPPMLNSARDPSVKEAVRYLKAQLPNCVIKCPGLSL